MVRKIGIPAAIEDLLYGRSAAENFQLFRSLVERILAFTFPARPPEIFFEINRTIQTEDYPLFFQ